MSKEQWIEEVYRLLCESLGAPKNATEEKNLREIAETMANDDCEYFGDGYTPREALGEEMSRGL